MINGDIVSPLTKRMKSNIFLLRKDPDNAFARLFANEASWRQDHVVDNAVMITKRCPSNDECMKEDPVIPQVRLTKRTNDKDADKEENTVIPLTPLTNRKIIIYKTNNHCFSVY